MADAPALLDSLAADTWRALLAHYPTFATQVAVHEHDHRLEDVSQSALAAWRATLAGLRQRLAAIDEAGLSEARQVTRAMLEEDLRGQEIAASTGMETWSVDQLAGPQVSLFDLVRVHVVHDAGSASTWLARVQAMPVRVDQECDNLRLGLAQGRVAAVPLVRRVLGQLDELLAADPADWPIVTSCAERPPDVGQPEWDAFKASLAAAARDGLRPAFERYRALLRDEIAPRARAVPGLAGLPDGEALYRACIRVHLGLDESPDALHRTGLAELARIRAEMERLCAELFPDLSLPEALRELRENPKHSFATREEIVEAARAAVRRATAAAQRCFDLLPDHECDVRPIDAHAEKASPAAFYMPPAPDGSRPGTYWVNTHEPSSRPRHDAEVVAFHEAVPGHHLQLALAQKMDAPDFQRHGHNTAFAEGWALYTERLADELGLYSGPIDRLGMLSCDALRACRLVVDTGLHAQGWSRERAVQTMRENTTSSLADIENEVDRYIAWPGQALSYKTGQLEILALRREAEVALGPKFRLGAFHAAVLEHGGVALPVLRRQIERYIAKTRS